MQQIKQWILNNTEAKGSLIERLLASRGIIKPEEIKEFLNPLEMTLTHPNAFTDMPKAVERITKAIDGGENILIYGDFDADGVTSTSLLMRTFTHLGANIDFFIPDREKEGHGLNSKALVKLMTQKKPKLIITVDCGVSDVEQVAFLNSFKIDTIITDHHEAPDEMPKAVAIINPKAKNALDEKLTTRQIEHLTSLAGVGVAFKLAQALLEHYEKTAFIYDLMPYVAVGTISDVVPLIGENRYFVTKGLQLISNGKHYGLQRLLEVAGYTLDAGITAENIAFGVSPRINASGRLASVDEAIKVMISDNKQEIEMSIISLNNFNKIRQELGQNIFLEAEEALHSGCEAGVDTRKGGEQGGTGRNRRCDEGDSRRNEAISDCTGGISSSNSDNAIILFNKDWHIGIVGIVASKLVEKYYKPAFLMTYSEETKQVRCSARSVDGVNLYDVLCANAEMFDGFGGHAMAAGLSFSTEKHSFEDVKKALNKTVNEMLKTQKLVPTLKVDVELTPKELDINLIEEIQKLEPCGACNPTPVFVMNDVTLKQKKLMGSNKDHLKLTVQRDDETFDCIRWSQGDISLVVGDKLDIAFCPQSNTYNGSTTLQLILQDIHSEALAEEIPTSEVKIYDHRKKTDILQQVNDYILTSKLDIAVFAEDKEIIEKLKPYKALTENIINRQTLKNASAVMFFDYPTGEESMSDLLATINPNAIHFMNYEVKKFDEQSFLKTLSGMIKYTHNNLNGVLNLLRCGCALSQSTEAIAVALEVFEECGMIKIKSRSEKDFAVEFISNTEISKVLHTIRYKDFLDLIEQTELYRLSIIENDVLQI